jgi:hypothetical protein
MDAAQPSHPAHVPSACVRAEDVGSKDGVAGAGKTVTRTGSKDCVTRTSSNTNTSTSNILRPAIEDKEGSRKKRVIKVAAGSVMELDCRQACMWPVTLLDASSACGM